MRYINLQSILGLMIGAVIGVSAFAVRAHVNAGAHSQPAHQQLLSISGSPAQLAERSEGLAAHVCTVIEAAEQCPLVVLAVGAASDLNALQARYEEGQKALHQSLISSTANDEGVQAAQNAQLALQAQSSRRYLRFLNDAAATLSVEQKQRFAH